MASAEEHSAYLRDGFFIRRGMFDAEEIAILRACAISDELQRGAYELDDGEGLKTKMVLWNTVGQDAFGLVARSSRIVRTVESLLGGEVYHYHSKLIMKQPWTGGSFAWHQDYGYWYLNGCLFPEMASVFIAIDPNTKENGCLQVLRGSHKMGRVDHGEYGDQKGADPERVQEAMKRLELVYCVLQPGDALIFDCNVLHRSNHNLSPNPRWSLICCYNTKHNNPYKKSHHPFYEPLDVIEGDEDQTALKRFGSQPLSAATVDSLLNIADDKTVATNQVKNQ
eukprot:TRINITY_DN558_c0_g1_i1.p1 TRINITY_DN558_c0_g1~~TRINITY_DN558_c0_g1_i1.p1  ORF type:complete len:281 (+),score=42.17 TRINITY_DN558_c0_g1_i1:246-1088(+)